jgi:hypothetical protein
LSVVVPRRAASALDATSAGIAVGPAGVTPPAAVDAAASGWRGPVRPTSAAPTTKPATSPAPRSIDALRAGTSSTRRWPHPSQRREPRAMVRPQPGQPNIAASVPPDVIGSAGAAPFVAAPGSSPRLNTERRA